MLNIVENYKKLFGSFVISKFEGVDAQRDFIDQKDSAEEIRALQRALKSENKLDSGEIQEIAKGIESIEADSKEAFKEVANTMLNSGFEVSDMNTYNSFKKIIDNSVVETTLPEWSEITTKLGAINGSYNKEDLKSVTINGTEVSVVYDALGLNDTYNYTYDNAGALTLKSVEDNVGWTEDFKTASNSVEVTGINLDGDITSIENKQAEIKAVVTSIEDFKYEDALPGFDESAPSLDIPEPSEEGLTKTLELLKTKKTEIDNHNQKIKNHNKEVLKGARETIESATILDMPTKLLEEDANKNIVKPSNSVEGLNYDGLVAKSAEIKTYNETIEAITKGVADKLKGLTVPPLPVGLIGSGEYNSAPNKGEINNLTYDQIVDKITEINNYTKGIDKYLEDKHKALESEVGKLEIEARPDGLDEKIKTPSIEGISEMTTEELNALKKEINNFNTEVQNYKEAQAKAAKEQAAREQAAREQAARELAARELAARELAARELAAKEQTEQASQSGDNQGRHGGDVELNSPNPEGDNKSNGGPIENSKNSDTAPETAQYIALYGEAYSEGADLNQLEAQRKEQVNALINKFKSSPSYGANNLVSKLYNETIIVSRPTTQAEMQRFQAAMDAVDNMGSNNQGGNEKPKIEPKVEATPKEGTSFSETFKENAKLGTLDCGEGVELGISFVDGKFDIDTPRNDLPRDNEMNELVASIEGADKVKTIKEAIAFIKANEAEVVKMYNNLVFEKKVDRLLSPNNSKSRLRSETLGEIEMGEGDDKKSFDIKLVRDSDSDGDINDLKVKVSTGMWDDFDDISISLFDKDSGLDAATIKKLERGVSLSSEETKKLNDLITSKISQLKEEFGTHVNDVKEEKENEENLKLIEEQLEDAQFSIKDLLGVDPSTIDIDSREAKWLMTLRNIGEKGSIEIDVNSINIKNNEIKFDLDDNRGDDEAFNKGITIKGAIKADGTFDDEAFKANLPAAIEKAITAMETEEQAVKDKIAAEKLAAKNEAKAKQEAADKKAAEEAQEKADKVEAKRIQKELKGAKFSVSDLLGDVKYESDEALWLKEFGDDIREVKEISLNDIDVNMKDKTITFDFSDSGWRDESFNQNLIIGEEAFDKDGKFSKDLFAEALKTQAKEAIKRMKNEK